MLINCVAYQNGAKLAEPSIEDISEYLKQPGRLVWVALRDATNGELDKMQEEFGLHDLAVEDARHGHQRPKIGFTMGTIPRFRRDQMKTCKTDLLQSFHA
jgi:magnesium transporter